MESLPSCSGQAKLVMRKNVTACSASSSNCSISSSALLFRPLPSPPTPRRHLSRPNSSAFMKTLAVYFTAIVVMSNSVEAVDRSNFKTCEQSSFCKRHRSTETGASRFFVAPSAAGEAFNVSYATATALLRRAGGEQAAFTLKIVGLSDGRFRVQVDEAEPNRKRFVAAEALDGPPKEQRFKSFTSTDDSAQFETADGHKLVVFYRPFRLDAYSAGDLVISLNSQGLLKFEEFRRRKTRDSESPTEDETWWRWFARPLLPTQPSPPFQQSEREEGVDEEGVGHEEQRSDENAEKAEEEGMWEETWKSHHDSKPHGASSVGLDVAFIGFKFVYGLPQHADKFPLKSTTGTDPYRLYNLDVFEYELNTPMALYGSVPYVVAHSATRTVSVLWLNAAETWVDVKSSTADKSMLRGLLDRFKASSGSEVPQVDTHFMSESGLVDLFLFLGPKPTDVFRQYTALTGVTPLPPMFAIAYHQCRWNYNDQEDVLSVDAGFDEHDLPMDVIWLDIEHTHGKRYFTWDGVKFPNSIEMQKTLARKGRKMVTIVDPHLKKDDGYEVYKDIRDKGYATKDSGDRDYEGHCWPGSSIWPDFFNPEVRQYWADQFDFDRYRGTTETLHIWNDMNEPSVFSGPEVTMHKDAKHFGGWEHRDVHNMYAQMHHSASWQGLLQRSNHQLRPFLLTRGFFVGSQRTAAVWTGDNMAEWSHLKAVVPMLLSLSVGGIVFCGADVGGFFKNPEEELLVRWYQAGVYQPFFRAHAHIDTRRREPWLFSPQALDNIRQSLKRRYALLPYLYTVFEEHSRVGVPVMRPLWLEFPDDEGGFDEEDEFMLGDAILVKPVTEAGAHSVSVYLPKEHSMWYDFDTLQGRPGPGAVHVDTPMTKIPVFLRGGTIVPFRQRIRRSSALMSHDPVTLYVNLDYDGKHAVGLLYLDDGATFEYQKGQFLHRQFEFKSDSPSVAAISSRNFNETGRLQSDVWIEKILVLGLKLWPRLVHLYYEDYKAVVLEFAFDRETSSMTIRKPAVRVDKDWRIDIHA